MSDLRDRIAAAITGIRIQRDGDAYQMADAVIRRMKADSAKIVNCAYCNWQGTPEELTTQHLNGCP